MRAHLLTRRSRRSLGSFSACARHCDAAPVGYRPGARHGRGRRRSTEHRHRARSRTESRCSTEDLSNWDIKFAKNELGDHYNNTFRVRGRDAEVALRK